MSPEHLSQIRSKCRRSNCCWSKCRRIIRRRSKSRQSICRGANVAEHSSHFSEYLSYLFVPPGLCIIWRRSICRRCICRRSICRKSKCRGAFVAFFGAFVVGAFVAGAYVVSPVYRDIASAVDHQILQHDLAQLFTWSSVWQMSFNVKKCGVLSITRKRSPSIFDYKLHNDVIPRPTEYKYLGVTVTPDLRWNTHCQKIRHKASRTLGLIRRTLSPCSMEVKTRAYAALVRPQLEYAAEAWNPHTVTTINALEQVQKAAARFVHGDYRRTTSFSALVSALGWHTLHN